jgi:ABC-2 type transport system permease protein
MRLLSIFVKSMKEHLRDPLVLSLSLAFAPFFVILYGMFFPSTSTTFSLLVENRDRALQIDDGTWLSCGDDIVQSLRELTYANNGDPILEVEITSDRETAEGRISDRRAHALLVLPEDLSSSVWQARSDEGWVPAEVTFIGDLTSQPYVITAVMANAVVDEYIQQVTGQLRPIQIVEIPLGASAERSEFEIYVPGLFIFAVVMLIFQASMVIAREVESGTLRRLQVSHMTAFDYLGGSTLALVVIAIVQVLLTFFTAEAMGFRSHGSLWLAILIGFLTSLSIIGTGLIVACVSKNVSQAFIIANFPMTLFMFFSGAIYPVNSVPLFTLGERTISLFDALPPTHAVVAMNKVFTLGAGLEGILFELGALALLSLLYFGLGVWLFSRTQLKPQ